MNITIALAGNQNCGKTTLFNCLTGSHQHTGNFPGVTVEKKEGRLIGHNDITIVDLPGLYSLSTYTFEERVAQQFLLNETPDAILNIIDATSLERSLYLTMQLMETGIPMVLAFNMMDEVEASGNTICISCIEQKIGVPIFPISALKGTGIRPLIDAMIRSVSSQAVPNTDFYRNEIGRLVNSIESIVKSSAQSSGISPRFCAVKFIDNDKTIVQRLQLSQQQLTQIETFITQTEQKLGMDRDAALADARYQFIEKLCAATVIKIAETKEQLRSVRIDTVLTHKIWGIPIFLCIMFAIFYLTFGVFGAFFSGLFSDVIKMIGEGTSRILTSVHINPYIHSLLIDGIFAGVGSILSFLPIVVTLFFFLSLLEDSGYMARVAFVLDKPLQQIGLSGRSFVPMLIGFGCSVPAIMATRTLPEDKNRKLTILLVPFMSCSAKLPVYAIFCAAFFPHYGAFIMMGCYLLGILSAILSGLLLNNTVLKSPPVPFLMELPAYRFPSPKSIILLMRDKAGDFIKKTFTVILLSTIVIWFLQRFDFLLQPVADSSISMLATIGRLLCPLFLPLGFHDWRTCAALLTGFSAKETIISTLTVLTGAGKAGTLTPLLPYLLTIPAALSYLSFIVLYTPCIAAISAARRELGSIKGALGIMAYQTVFAWIIAFFVYRLSMFIL